MENKDCRFGNNKNLFNILCMFTHWVQRDLFPSKRAHDCSLCNIEKVIDCTREYFLLHQEFITPMQMFLVKMHALRSQSGGGGGGNGFHLSGGSFSIYTAGAWNVLLLMEWTEEAHLVGGAPYKPRSISRASQISFSRVYSSLSPAQPRLLILCWSCYNTFFPPTCQIKGY